MDLPDDPELAFVQYEEVLRKRIHDSLENSNGHNAGSLRIEYMYEIIGVAKALGIEQFQNWDIPPAHDDDESIYNYYAQLIA